MRVTSLFGNTLKDTPTSFNLPSQNYLIKAGYIRRNQQLIIGLPIYSKLVQKIIDLINSNYENPQEIQILNAHSHQSIIHELIDDEITSYKQLPKQFYSIITNSSLSYKISKGLLYTKNRLIYYLYSLYSSTIAKNNQYHKLLNIWKELFNQINLPVILARGTRTAEFRVNNKVDNDDKKPNFSLEFVYFSKYGENQYAYCIQCNYYSRIEVAQFKKIIDENQEVKEIELISTPNTATIDSLAELLGIKTSSCAKAVFYNASFPKESKLILAIVRGDMDVNDYAVQQVIGALSFKTAENAEIRSAGAEPGFASAIGIDRKKCLVIVDEIIPKSINLVAGANISDKHYLNTNYGIDYTADIIANISKMNNNSICATCSQTLSIQNGVLLLECFENISHSSKYLNAKGKPNPTQLLESKFNLTRLIGCIAEEFHDITGLIFPKSIAPFQIILLLLGKKEQTKEVADKLYNHLCSHFDILYDDRDIRPGSKFADTDLRGIPLRVVVSDRLGDKIEIKLRSDEEKILVSIDAALQEITSILASNKNLYNS